MLANYTLFTAKLTRVFGVYKKVATAKQLLEKLHQWGSAHLYTAEFQQICYRLTSARLCWVAISWHGVGCRLWDTG